MFGGLRHVCLLFLLASAITRAHQAQGTGSEGSNSNVDSTTATSTAKVITSSTSPVLTGNATCASRTVNYITHTLPQQCLRTDRAVSNRTESSLSSATANVTSVAYLAEAHPPPDSPVSVHTTVDATPLADTPTAATVIASSPKDTAAPPQETASAGAPDGPDSAVVPLQDSDAEADPLLDNANFLSFEAWKKQNLAKTGQSPENVGQERSQAGGRQRPGINNALDTLGEESEIDLDFSGFGGGAVARSSDAGVAPSSSAGVAEKVSGGQSASSPSKLRSKDAGRTCKERTNFASFDCSANVMKTNSECKSASSVLVENKDSYMLNICTAKNKFFIVELCNDIHIDTIVLANYEFFSSIFRHFRVSVSDRYPVKMEKWRELGTFEARNTREVQAFLVEDPQIWARYLRIEFLTHYGSEYYCPLSLLRVHGKTMMQEFRQEEEMARGELLDEEPALEAEVTATSVAQEPLPSADEAEKVNSQATRTLESSVAPIPEPAVASNVEEGSSAELFSSLMSSDNATGLAIPEPAVPTFDELTCALSTTSTTGPVSASAGNSSPSKVSSNPDDVALSGSAGATSVSLKVGQDTPGSQSSLNSSTSTVTSSTDAGHGHVMSSPTTAAQTRETPAASNSTTSAALPMNSTSIPASSSPSSPSTNTTRSVATASPSPQASSQESFFKSIHKRLQQLESNSTLSLQYIEEQSRILRDAFNKVEKRQISATTAFLSQLNGTVMTELQGFRQAYDQLWQSTVIELEGQREQYQREMLALSSRLTLVADELVWQKRMGIVQSTLLLLCLGLVLFARQGNGYLDMTLAQQFMTKSQAAFRTGWESEPNSPSPGSRSPVSMFRRKIWRSSTEPVNDATSDGTDTRPQTRDGGPVVDVEPPTPPTDDEFAEGDDADDLDLTGTQSGPATPGGTAAGLKRPPSPAGGSRPSSPLGSE